MIFGRVFVSSASVSVNVQTHVCVHNTHMHNDINITRCHIHERTGYIYICILSYFYHFAYAIHIFNAHTHMIGSIFLVCYYCCCRCRCRWCCCSSVYVISSRTHTVPHIHSSGAVLVDNMATNISSLNVPMGENAKSNGPVFKACKIFISYALRSSIY